MLRKLLQIFSKTASVSKPPFTTSMITNAAVRVGKYTYGCPGILQYGEGTSLVIGNYCSIADGVTIFLGGNHRTDWVTTYPFNVLSDDFPNARVIKGHPASKGNVVIGNDVWIGKDVTILSGVTIGDGAVLAACAVVTASVEPYQVVGGNPAKHIRYRFSPQIIRDLLEIKWWNWDVAKVNKYVSQLCNDDINSFIREHKTWS